MPRATRPPAVFSEIEIVSDDGRVVIGRAVRTGVTPPFYPEHPVYRLQRDPTYGLRSGEVPEGYFVWDGREFHPSDEWHRAKG